MNVQETVLEICQERAEANAKDFFATYVAGVASISPLNAELLLDELVSLGLLTKRFELSCPMCGRTVEYVDEVKENDFFADECPKCSEEIYAGADRYRAVYTPVKELILYPPVAADGSRLRNSLLAE